MKWESVKLVYDHHQPHLRTQIAYFRIQIPVSTVSLVGSESVICTYKFGSHFLASHFFCNGHCRLFQYGIYFFRLGSSQFWSAGMFHLNQKLKCLLENSFSGFVLRYFTCSTISVSVLRCSHKTWTWNNRTVAILEFICCHNKVMYNCFPYLSIRWRSV
jgi:hypothetical protein